MTPAQRGFTKHDAEGPGAFAQGAGAGIRAGVCERIYAGEDLRPVRPGVRATGAIWQDGGVRRARPLFRRAFRTDRTRNYP